MHFILMHLRMKHLKLLKCLTGSLRRSFVFICVLRISAAVRLINRSVTPLFKRLISPSCGQALMIRAGIQD